MIFIQTDRTGNITRFNMTPHQWGGRLIIMAGTEQMEWHRTPGNNGNHGNHVFDVFDTIPLIPPPAVTTSPSSPIRVPPTSFAPHAMHMFT